MNILIIEDDRTISALMGRTLTGAGYECGFAYDGAEAEELFDSHPWDLVLLDLMLPAPESIGLRPPRIHCAVQDARDNSICDGTGE